MDRTMRRLRKRYRVLLLSTIVGALIVPVGYALSADSAPPRSYAQIARLQTTAAVAVAAPLVAHTRTPASPDPAPLPSVLVVVKLLLVGTSLFGLAAAVRKAH